MTARPGVALMVVLWLVVALGTICTGVIVSTRSTASAAANYRAAVVGRYAAESGITLALAAIEDSLATMSDPAARRDFLNNLDRALQGRDEVSLGDARFAVALVDVGSRLDVNVASEASLTTLFSFLADANQAASAARAIRTFIAGGPAPTGELGQRVGQPGVLRAARPVRSVQELTRIPGVPGDLAERSAHFLTVDGDGTINRATASDTVLAAAAGGLRDEPSRILIISRGWLYGQPLTHEIEAVYAVVGRRLTLIRWREGDL